MGAVTNKARIARFIWQEKVTSKLDISKGLSISMPTVLQNVNDLMAFEIIMEAGEYESTGGRKAKSIVINPDKKFAVGIDLTLEHIGCVTIDLFGNILLKKRYKVAFEDSYEYFSNLPELVEDFIDKAKIDREKLLGVGISLPGIVNHEHTELVRSHVFKIKNLNLKFIKENFKYPVQFENDANSALLAELSGNMGNTVYLSLSNSVGGAICTNGAMYLGDNARAGEIGHVIIEKDGKQCYCGKKGCIDAYCSAHLLSDLTEHDLDLFFVRLEAGDEELVKAWDDYLEYLAIAITNVRMCYDCDIILGGYVGARIDKYMNLLIRKMKKYNLFDYRNAYINTCNRKVEASALGIAIKFIKDYFDSL
jgi:predicted NBD/HSP70 family sugar kinase